MRRALLLAAGLAVLGLLATADAEAQCAMCRTALESPEGRKMASAFRRGILVLGAAPVLAVSTIGYLVVRSRRRQHARLQAGAVDS